MVKIQRNKISYLLTEYHGEISILLAVILYVIGVLSLTTIESPLFVVCSYLSTFLFVGGLLAKLGLFPTVWRSRSGLSVIIFFASALCFTTAMSALFINVGIEFSILERPPSGGPSQPNPSVFEYGYPRAVAPDISTFGNVNLEFRRTFVPLILPLAKVGILLLVIAVLMAWLDKRL